MAGLPPKPEFQMPPRFEREDERHYRGSGGGRSPSRRRARSPAVDSYVPGAAGGRGRRSGPSSYHRSRSPPPRRERLDTYRPGGERDRAHDYERERERERFDPREREWIPATQSRRGGGERESWDARNAREKAERLAKEGRQASRRQRDWKTRDEAAAYDRRRERERERERSRSPPRRRSYSRRTSPSTSPHTQRSTRQARSPSREETPEEGAVTPEHRKRRRQPSSSRSRSPSTRTRSTRSSASRSRSPAVKKHRLPTSTLKHTSPPTRLAPLPTKPAAGTSTAPAATASLEKPAEASSSSTRVPTPQPVPTSKWPTVPSTAPSPAIPSQAYRDKGKAREDRRDAEGDVRMTDAPAIIVNTPTPTPQSQPAHGLPARPIPTEPARHNQHPPQSDRMKLHDHNTDRKPTNNNRPIPTQPASASHSKQLPKGPKQRGGSPDPIAIRKRWEQRDMSKEQRERAEKAAENERREYASYQTAMSAYHLKNPSTVSFELRRKLRQATHELVVTLLDSGAAEKRRDVAEAGCERARAGVLGEGVMGSPVLQ